MISKLQQSLIEYDEDKLETDAFIALWREQGGVLCDQLPSAYRKVLDDMLMRVESSRLFSAESCSFSRESLMDVFKVWLDKAEARLLAGGQIV